MHVAKRRRLVAHSAYAPAVEPSNAASQSPTDSAYEAGSDTDSDSLRMPPPALPHRAAPRRSFAQALAGASGTESRTLSTPQQPILSPSPSRPAPAMPQTLPPEPPAAPLGALAQLRLQQGPSIDQWRETALASIDAAADICALRDAVEAAQFSLNALDFRPAWRARRDATFAALVEQSFTQLASFAAEPQDLLEVPAFLTALQTLCPEQHTQARPHMLQCLARLAEAALCAAGADVTALEHAFAALETMLPQLALECDATDAHALRESIVSSLWYRLLEAPQALSTQSIPVWTHRSLAMCHMRPAPQIAALVWLRALLDMPSLSVEQCVVYTHQLRQAWAVPEAAAAAAAGSNAGASHLPSEPDFEPAARAQLTGWVATLTEQLPALAPFQAEPVRVAFGQLAEALHIHIDIEIGLPSTDGDADMQARESARFIAEWVREHGEAFPGYEALFAEARSQGVGRPSLFGSFVPYDALFDSDDTWPTPPRAGTPYAPSPTPRASTSVDPGAGSPNWLEDSPPHDAPGAVGSRPRHVYFAEQDLQDASSQSEYSDIHCSPSSSEHVSDIDTDADGQSASDADLF